MKKILSRSDVDKLLGRDHKKRPPTPEEIKLLQDRIRMKMEALNIDPSEKLPRHELEKILLDLGFDDIELILD